MQRPLALAVVALWMLPALGFAAFDDVTLTTDTVISVGGYTLNISGSSATIQSVVVDANSFSVTLASGSEFKVSSPTRNQLSSDVTSNVAENTCTDSESSITLTYSGGGTVTNIITPSATICRTTSSSGNSSSVVGNGAPLSGPLSLRNGSDVSSTTTATPSLPATSTTRVTGSHFIFKRDMRLRTAHADVRELQKYLNAQGFLVAKTGVGSPGKETTYFGTLTQVALAKFQEAHVTEILTPVGLSKGTGYFGPSTRAFVNIGH